MFEIAATKHVQFISLHFQHLKRSVLQEKQEQMIRETDFFCCCCYTRLRIFPIFFSDNVWRRQAARTRWAHQKNVFWNLDFSRTIISLNVANLRWWASFACLQWPVITCRTKLSNWRFVRNDKQKHGGEMRISIRICLICLCPLLYVLMCHNWNMNIHTHCSLCISIIKLIFGISCLLN